MADADFEAAVGHITSIDRRYRAEAYSFVSDAVLFTQRRCSKESAVGEARHVSGHDLIFGCVDFAKEQFGPLAWTVFQDWGLVRGASIGDVVWHLIDERILTAGPGDTRMEYSLVGDLAVFFRTKEDSPASTGGKPPFIA